jgi:site-specific recombinase XerD
MATYLVYQKGVVNKKGEAPVYIGFYIDRKKVEVPTKISLPPVFFDKDRGVVKTAYEYARDKNLIISDLKATINDIFVRYRLRGQALTAELFWKEFRSRGQYADFFSFCKAYQSLRFQEISIATQKKHRACLNTLRTFKASIFFDELTPDFFRQFVLYLRNRRGNEEITINKTLHVIAIYLNDAVARGLLQTNPIRSLKLRGFQETTAEALTEDELKRLTLLYGSNCLPETQQGVLEFFLFMCLSSLHISDAKKLMIEQIGETEFTYVRAKMLHIRPRVVHVPISQPLRTIINRQRGTRTRGLLWSHVLSDQKINKHLKGIASIAGITTKNLSAKVGRHTFATIFLRRTRDMNALREIMGHSNIRQTLVYSHVMDTDRQTGIQVFNEFEL